MRAIAAALALAGWFLALAPEGTGAQETGGHASSSASVLMYHGFGEDPEGETGTAISLELFEQHIAELTGGGYAVLPLPVILEAQAKGEPLPDRAVAITLDDAWKSSYELAWPRLKAAGLPFTLFISTDNLDEARPAYMSWDQLRELRDSGQVAIGLQGRSHAHMTGLSLAEARDELAHSLARAEAELGGRPAIFSYPYGEFGADLRALVEETGFLAAFGQQSGAFDASEDRFSLPRFAMSQAYGDLDRLRLAANALPIPAEDISPADPLLTPETNPPLYGFTLTDPATFGKGIACFAGGSKVEVVRLADVRIEVRLDGPFRPGRQRINCTQQGPEGRWRWRSILFTVPGS